ncbi:hypothetical protein JXQ31_20100 [candidate division KSB1 bacterium]|nr:hypothetical protein [candidate division KSB1 bacterium]
MNLPKIIIRLGILSLVLSCNSILAQDFNDIKAKADLAYINSNYDEALGLYRSIMKLSDVDSVNFASVYANAGICCENLQKNAEAIVYYKEAVNYNVPQFMIYDKLIFMAKDANDNSTYEFALLRKQSQFPEFEIEVKQKLAYLYYNTQQYQQLLDISNSLLEWYPDYPKYHLFNAVARQNLNDIVGAEKEFERTLALDPEDAGANMGKGLILFNKANEIYDNCRSKYETIANPNRIDYSDYRKCIEEPKEIFRECLPYLLKAYENKSYSSLKNFIQKAYLRLGEKENADKY